MPRPKKPPFEFTPEERAVWRAMQMLPLCPKYRRVGFDKVLAHIKKDSCETMPGRPPGDSANGRVDLVFEDE
jgi:hypothetical protein